MKIISLFNLKPYINIKLFKIKPNKEINEKKLIIKNNLFLILILNHFNLKKFNIIDI